MDIGEVNFVEWFFSGFRLGIEILGGLLYSYI